MFHDVPQAILVQMRELERIDNRDRVDGTPRMKRLRQIPPVVGKFIALLADRRRSGAGLRLGRVRDIPHCGWRFVAGEKVNLSDAGHGVPWPAQVNIKRHKRFTTE